MSIEDRRVEVLKFIESNFSSVEEYVNGLSKEGAKDILDLFGLTAKYSCGLDLKIFRNILREVLEFNLDRMW